MSQFLLAVGGLIFAILGLLHAAYTLADKTLGAGGSVAHRRDAHLLRAANSG
jgi:hypothetical protein